MQYTLAELRSLCNVYMAEIGTSRRALSEKITPGNPNTVRRVFEQGYATTDTVERLSDWFDENWPAGVGWPAEVEQRQSGFRQRAQRQQEGFNIRARKLRRFDDRMRELTRHLRLIDGEGGMVQVARRLTDEFAAVGSLLDDMRNTLGSSEDENRVVTIADDKFPETAMLQTVGEEC
jgi:hypothetical protein